MIIMALDYGDRYVGVAVSDDDGKIALRHSVIDAKEQKLFEEVKKIIEGEKVERIVVGVPRALSGDETLQSKKTKEFMKALEKEVGENILVEEADETFTSLEARRKIMEEGGNMDDEHAEAARLILGSYIGAKS